MNNLETFYSHLVSEYKTLFVSGPEYAYAAARMTPQALALKMTLGLAVGTVNKDGQGVKNTCKALGLKCQYKTIRAYFDVDDVAKRNEHETALRLRFQNEQ